MRFSVIAVRKRCRRRDSYAPRNLIEESIRLVRLGRKIEPNPALKGMYDPSVSIYAVQACDSPRDTDVRI